LTTRLPIGRPSPATKGKLRASTRGRFSSSREMQMALLARDGSCDEREATPSDWPLVVCLLTANQDQRRDGPVLLVRGLKGEQHYGVLLLFPFVVKTQREGAPYVMTTWCAHGVSKGNRQPSLSLFEDRVVRFYLKRGLQSELEA
jgi:hypothetical protein